MRQNHPNYYTCGMKTCKAFGGKSRCWFTKNILEQMKDDEVILSTIISMRAGECADDPKEILASMNVKRIRTKW